jgi:two-component system, response regulator PdtaR
MPGSMNGFALAQQVVGRWRHIRLIITSGRHWPNSDDLPDDGQFLHKPYRMTQLINAIGHAA